MARRRRIDGDISLCLMTREDMGILSAIGFDKDYQHVEELGLVRDILATPTMANLKAVFEGTGIEDLDREEASEALLVVTIGDDPADEDESVSVPIGALTSFVRLKKGSLRLLCGKEFFSDLKDALKDAEAAGRRGETGVLLDEYIDEDYDDDEDW